MKVRENSRVVPDATEVLTLSERGMSSKMLLKGFLAKVPSRAATITTLPSFAHLSANSTTSALGKSSRCELGSF